MRGAGVSRRRKRFLIIITLLLVLLILIVATIINYRATRTLTLPFVRVAGTTLTAPEYLYSFAGPEGDRLTYPIGILVDEEQVFVADSRSSRVFVFSVQGDLLYTFGEDVLITPLYIARNPVNGHLYISDRRNRAIQVFTTDGDHVAEFQIDLPEEERPPFETGGVQWVPIAIAFGDDGSMYVTDLLTSHRLLIFDPDGRFVRSVGTAGLAERAAANPEFFQFPNGVKVREGMVWVADSNNRRLKLYSSDGEFERLIPTDGLPRGFDFVVKESAEETPSTYVAVVDTLAHDVTFWSEGGGRVLTFGRRGILEGEFSYPNDLSVGERDRIFVTDSANGRVQVWGWPEEIAPVPAVTVPPYWLWCLSPLLLLPLLLLLRRKRFLATDDFLEAMIADDDVDTMTGRRILWLVMPETYERFKDVRHQEVDFSELLSETEYSDSDARALMERIEVDHATAALLSVAVRARVFCAEGADLRKIARALDVDVVSRTEYIERFGERKRP